MIAIPIQRALAAQKKMEKQIGDLLKAHKAKVDNMLNSKRRKNDTASERDYVKLIVDDWDTLVKMKPDELRENKGKYRLPEAETGQTAKQHTAFKIALIRAMGYQVFREAVYPAYFEELGIKACVYCNAQLAVSAEHTTEKGVRKTTGRFQVDHYWDKATYPAYCISFFNLYPACASCNLVKKNREVDFDLYSGQQSECEKSNFKFGLKKGSVASYLSTAGRPLAALKLKFDEPTPSGEAEKFEAVFGIKGIYETQKDVVEELVFRKEAYNGRYLANLRKTFARLNLSQAEQHRFLIGNYSSETEIHKRPLAKFTQDIARQLKLISSR